MTVIQELHELVDTLDDDTAREVLDYLHWLRGGPEHLTEEELAQVREGQTAIERGEYVLLDDLRRQLLE